MTMARKLPVLACTAASLIALSACGTPVTKADINNRAHYWQRADASSAIYQRGPKAQQMLHQDISRCVVEIRELEHLGSIRRAIPVNTDENGNVADPDTPEGQMKDWESPERHGALRAEHLDYHDFETCMHAKGWERIEHVPYNVAEEAREVYIETILGEQYRTKVGDRDSDAVASAGRSTKSRDTFDIDGNRNSSTLNE